MSIPLFDLTGFQRDVLYVACGIDEPSGQTIKAELEQGTADITHGRLYPNLDTLVERGYLQKRQFDQRTNVYSISESGREKLLARHRWERRYVDFE